MTTRQSFKVLTLNTWQKSGPWEERWDAILQNLGRYQPDVVGFQELFDPAWRDRVARQAGYPFIASPAPDRSGLVLLSRLPIVQSAVSEFGARSPFETYGRYLLWAELALPGGKIHVFNTHLSWMAQDTATRLAQVREIAAQIEARCAGESRLVVGDLNAAPDSDEIRWLLKHAGLVDTFAAIHPADPGFTWHARNRFTSEQQPNLPDRRIDYILAAGEEIVGALRSCRIVCDVCTETGIFPSDHYGVMAEFTLENP